jgi:hypothetical protein
LLGSSCAREKETTNVEGEKERGKGKLRKGRDKEKTVIMQ